MANVVVLDRGAVAHVSSGSVTVSVSIAPRGGFQVILGDRRIGPEYQRRAAAIEAAKMVVLKKSK
jgi:hypothetical protein